MLDVQQARLNAILSIQDDIKQPGRDVEKVVLLHGYLHDYLYRVEYYNKNGHKNTPPIEHAPSNERDDRND